VSYPSERIRTITGIEVDDVRYENVLAVISKLNDSVKRELQTVCAQLLDNHQIGKVERERIIVIRILVALLPDSKQIIIRWIREKHNAYSSEVRFTIFCYLDWLANIPNGIEASDEILQAVETYLQSVPSNTARAAWMAGDMLGGHWNAVESLPVVKRLVAQGRYAAGRSAGVYSLKELLERPELTAAARAQIKNLLTSVARNDRSRLVRSAAKL
jgi:hypothetical protein